MDVLSEVLGAVRLNAAFYFEVNAAVPCVSTNPSMAEIGSAVMPQAEHVVPFHLMVEGSAWAKPSDGSLPPTPFESGDIIMFPEGSGHIISSEQNSSELPDPDLRFYRDAAKREASFTLVEIGGAATPRSSSAAIWVAMSGRSTRCQAPCRACSSSRLRMAAAR
jgi:hypothetical protein